jgi:NADPH2:quinone reductase
MLMTTMKVPRFGGPRGPRAREAPVPEPGPGEALVALEVADVIALDATLRAGAAQDWFALRPPYVPGGGGRAGRGGRDPEDAHWVGRRVTARLGHSGALARGRSRRSPR